MVTPAGNLFTLGSPDGSEFESHAKTGSVVVMIAVSQQAFITDKRLQTMCKHGHQACAHIAVIAIRVVIILEEGVARGRSLSDRRAVFRNQPGLSVAL